MWFCFVYQINIVCQEINRQEPRMQEVLTFQFVKKTFQFVKQTIFYVNLKTV